MDLLEKHLPKYDNNEKNWIYSENLYLYNKYTQAFDIKPVLKQYDIKPVLKQDDIKPVLKQDDIKPVLKQDDIKPVLKQDDIKPVLKQDDIKLINLINIKPKLDKKNKKNPYDIIIEMTENNNIYIDYIKTELNNFISTKDFQKVFGIKKTSEIMSGLTNNKWNKSLVLFLSFLFNIKFIYLNKDVSFSEYDKCITL